MSPCVSVGFFLQTGKVESLFYGFRGKIGVWKPWRGHYVPRPLPLKGVVTRGKVNKGVSRPRTVFGSCREREDLQLSSEVARWLHWVAHSKSTKGLGCEGYLPLHFKRLLKALHSTGPYSDPCLAKAFRVF